MINKIRLIKFGHSGMTLVETMVAILVFGLLLGGMMNITVASITSGKRAEYAYNAYNLAKNHIETLKALPFSSLSSAAETDTYLDNTGVPDDDGNFKRTTTVTTSYTGDANLVQVQVQVDYRIKGVFANKPTTLTSVIFQYA